MRQYIIYALHFTTVSVRTRKVIMLRAGVIKRRPPTKRSVNFTTLMGNFSQKMFHFDFWRGFFLRKRRRPIHYMATVGNFSCLVGPF